MFSGWSDQDRMCQLGVISVDQKFESTYNTYEVRSCYEQMYITKNNL